MQSEYQVDSVEETWAVAKELAKELKSGDVVCLEGDLGAGKTTFTQGLCAALGAKRAVTSPTFCIVSEHPASDMLVVEWPDRAGSLIPANAKRVRLAYGEGENTRLVECAV